MPNRALIAALAVLSTLAVPGVAQAMNATVERDGSGVRVRVVGETTPVLSQNNISVSEDASGNLIVTDGNDSTGVVAGSGCFQMTPTTAGCPKDPTNTSQLQITSGEGDDIVGIDLPTRNNTGVATAFVNGGNGADAILGGGTVDTL